MIKKRFVKLAAVCMAMTLSVAPLGRTVAQDTTVIQRLKDWAMYANYVIPVAGYYHTASYPVGFYTGVIPGVWVPLRVGWSCHPDKDVVSETEFREPTWTLQFSELFGIGIDGAAAYGLLGGIDMGVYFVRKSVTEPTTGQVLEKKTVPYFSFTPKVGFSFAVLDFIVGYEFVPAYSRLSGWTFGVGFSIPTH